MELGDGSGPAGLYAPVMENLGHASEKTTPLPVVSGFQFPYIPEGSPTMLVTVPFPVTTTGVPPQTLAQEHSHLAGVIALSVLIWVLPLICINQKCCCCRCFRKFMSRRLKCYSFVAFMINMTLISIVIATEPDITANGLFFAMVKLVGDVTDHLEQALMQIGLLVGLFVAFAFRHRVVMLLGFDQQLVRADLRDCLTCFTMSRFRVIEVSLLRVEGLSASFGSRTLFVRVVCGYNEPQHSRPHDGCTTSCRIRERVQLNYDGEDDTQKLSVVVKQQEVVSAAVSQMAPVVGAFMGAAAGTVTPLGMTLGTGAGAVTGIGAANSLGKEVARVDFSSAQINRLLGMNKAPGGAPLSTQNGAWAEENFVPVDLVPQGKLWLRIAEVEAP